MERLTEKITNKETGNILAYRLKSNADRIKADKKLGEYEDLEEQGLLLKFPCKIGDTLYVIRVLGDGKGTLDISEFVVNNFEIRALQQFVRNYNGNRLNFQLFGKTVFLTKAEAEARLEELRGVE